MSKDAANSLAPPDATDPKSSKRKMTQAILEDQEKEKEVYEFLEDDDDFEEFENDEMDYNDIMAGDVEMDGEGAKKDDETDR